MARMLAEAAELAGATQAAHMIGSEASPSGQDVHLGDKPHSGYRFEAQFVEERRSSSTFALLSTAAVSSAALVPAIAAAAPPARSVPPTSSSSSSTSSSSTAPAPTRTGDLSSVVPPLRCCAVFHVRDNIAVGVDVRTAVVDGATPEVIRDVLVPLTAPGVLSTAVTSRRVAIGNPRDPTTMERTLFRFLRLSAPRSFCAVPVVRDGQVVAVIYADRDDSNIDALDLDELRELASTCA
jgi:hypothetical protein